METKISKKNQKICKQRSNKIKLEIFETIGILDANRKWYNK